ncbi:MAG: hypothetical protein FJ125_02310 [Deltaproteobacteria bacterium]|nr:hypothetical protein [Deltaproteobacteria bacterium]
MRNGVVAALLAETGIRFPEPARVCSAAAAYERCHQVEMSLRRLLLAHLPGRADAPAVCEVLGKIRADEPEPELLEQLRPDQLETLRHSWSRDLDEVQRIRNEVAHFRVVSLDDMATLARVQRTLASALARTVPAARSPLSTSPTRATDMADPCTSPEPGAPTTAISSRS